MALDKVVLGGLIKTNIGALFTIVDDATLTKVCNAIADAVVTHINTAAVVPAGTFKVLGVMAGMDEALVIGQSEVD